jgi:hypothetical protein
VVKEDSRAVLTDVSAVAGDFLLLQYMRDVVDELELCTLDGKHRQQVKLPGKGE